MRRIRQRIPILLAATLIVAALIQGCGGGGGSSFKSDVNGTVADVNRNVVIDADVWIGDYHAKSLASGAFRIAGVPSGWHTIRAKAVVDGRLWEGSTAVEVLENYPTMNANIVLAPAGDLTTITGYVYDNIGRRVEGAHVLVTTRVLQPDQSSHEDGAYGSIVAITDDRGFYRLEDVPMGISAVMTASKVAFDNDEVQVANINDRMTLDFELSPSVEDTPNAPTLHKVESWTMPNPLVRSMSLKDGQDDNPYDAVRAFMSPEFRESLESRKTASTSMPTVRAASANSLIEIDLYWNALDVNLSRYIAGYGIYRRDNLGDPSSAIDFIRDPYANFYGDMGGEVQPDVSYYYRVSAVHVEFLDRWQYPIDEAESNWSAELSIAPLGSLRADLPANGAGVGANPQFSWQPVARAAGYTVYVYDRFPTIPLYPGAVNPVYGTAPIWNSAWAPGTSVVYAGPALQAGRTYYWIVTARDAAQRAYSYGEMRAFTR